MNKQIVVAYFKVLSQQFQEETEESHAKPVRTSGLGANIQTCDLPYKKQQCKPHDYNGQ
jgi:hypothetical protein